ncbi:hypothetical protein Acor_37830 [Acrocarpospora corrugata]|uniref:phosphoserine phosphatase n=1 Tax=Acrocarpospora corrugata TaxID=35763 RepID=A0A5M3W0B6_9ACTN|nr:HAD-IB family phosphatase [Acrocarpospora corrugata]GES01719.1 hypothetical protein Acor_37830 [Acrocarpospora corrugata]
MSPTSEAPEIAILVDYDGTIATVDVTDELVRTSASERQWLDLELAYRRGDIGSRALLRAETRLLPGTAADLPDLARDQPHDPTFVPFVEYARAHGMTVEVVSDGLGFFVAPALATLGLGGLPVYSAALGYTPTGPEITFPNGHPACQVCGTCKRQRVLLHQAAGRHVVFIGDGYSDQYAAAHADTVFAKAELATICERRGLPFQRWRTFDDVHAWLTQAQARGALSGPVARPYVCGPETAR